PFYSNYRIGQLILKRSALGDVRRFFPPCQSALRYITKPGRSAIWSYSRMAVWLVSWAFQ
ncbi:hypothetical protein AB9C95_14060, partial [Serratia marcescens]|uniref:hypothetical protein n=1 Tax=Serratia marcescens TaxID=615 RepID=UPI00350F7F04